MTILRELVAAFRSQFQDPYFVWGFLEGTFCALIVGYASTQFLYWWNRMLQASRSPATQPGPSPMDNLGGCVRAAIVVTLVVLIALVLIFGL